MSRSCIICVVFALASRASAGSSIAENTAGPPRIDIDNGLYQLWWFNDTADSTTGVITVMMRARTTGAMSFSFAHAYTMRGIDSITGWVSDTSGAVTLFDEWSPNHDQPFRDSTRSGGKDDLFDVSGTQVGDTTTIQFSRKLHTGDKYDFPVNPGVMYMVWALYEEDGHGYKYDEHYTYGAQTVDFTTGEAFGASAEPSVVEPGMVLCILVLIALVLVAVGQKDHDTEMPRERATTRFGVDSLSAVARSSFLVKSRGFFNTRVPWSPFVAKHVGFLAIYLALVAFAFIVGTKLNSSNTMQNTGYLASGTMLVLLLPALRWGPLRVLSFSFDQMLPYHYILGTVAVVFVTIHAGVSILTWRKEAGKSVIDTLFSEHKYLMGFIAWACGMIIVATSLVTCLRRRFWEFFVVTHALYLLFYIFALLHTPDAFLPYFLVATLLLVVCKAIQVLLGLLPERTISLEKLPDGVVCVTFPKHKTAERLGLYGVAQHVLLNFPAISLFEWHPYTVASSPREPVLRVFVKGLGGHTRQLLEAAEKHDHLRIRVDGPYGHVRFGAYPVHVYVAGGIGITPIVSILKDVYDIDVPADVAARVPSAVLRQKQPRSRRQGDDDDGRGVVLARFDSSVEGEEAAFCPDNAVNPRPCAVTDIYLVWAVRTVSQYGWFAHELAEAQEKADRPDGLYPQLHVSVYVTQGNTTAGADLGTPQTQWKTGRPPLAADLRDIGVAHPHAGTMLFACGPKGMVDAAWDASAAENLKGNNWHVHREVFEF